jgi:hypothetical protein
MSRRIGTVAIAAVALVLAVAVAGCGGGVKNSSATTSATTGTTGTTASDGGGQSTTGTETVAGSTTSDTATGGTSDGTTAVAQETVKAPASQDGTVDIAVLGITVQGQLATLAVRFAPHFPSAAPDDTISLDDMSDNSLSQDQVSLVDPVGLKRYLVVKDANQDWLGADEVSTEAVNNSSVIAHWTFAAPSPDVTKLDVELGPFPPLNDIPISR